MRKAEIIELSPASYMVLCYYMAGGSWYHDKSKMGNFTSMTDVTKYVQGWLGK